MCSRAEPTRLSAPVFVLLVVVGIAISACLDANAPVDVEAPVTDDSLDLGALPTDVIPNRYIVVFKSHVQDAPGLARGLTSDHKGRMRFSYSTALKGFAADLPDEALEALWENPDVAYIEPDLRVQVSGVTEVQPGAAWGLDRIDQRGLPLSGSYSYSASGAGVRVYIVDSGIRTTHVDFGGRAAGGYSLVDDGYGANDCHGHGTRVAGLVGGATYGVAKRATLYSVRVSDCNGLAAFTRILAALDWVAQNRVLPAVVNMSLAGGASTAWNEAVQKVVDAGVTVVVAAGNSSDDACNYSPASAPQALTVGATLITDARSTWSNFGSCLDLFAPGENTYSTKFYSDTAWGPVSGTSMAAPQVAGAAALYLETHPTASPAEVSQALRGYATSGALSNIGSGSPNRLLYTQWGGGTEGGADGGSDGGSEPPPPPPPPPPSTDEAPYASFTSRCPQGACRFDASGSSDDHGIMRYTWDFGDGSSGVARSSPDAEHAYSAPGYYRVTLVVTDDAGQTGRTQRMLSIKKVR